MLIKNSHLVLDACCVLNLCASENFISILKTIPAQVVITEVVRQKELITLQRLDTKKNERIIQFEQAIFQKILLVVDFESEKEQETFINYAFTMGDDGESATGAIAFHRDWAIATDDKRAISFFQKEVPLLPIVSTLEIVKYWSENLNLSQEQLRTVLHEIQVKARYRPGKNHLLLDWWEGIMKSPSY
jgi:hypothetical protein